VPFVTKVAPRFAGLMAASDLGISRAPGAPSLKRTTPASSRARRIAARLLTMGVRLPVSKSRMVDRLTFERSARSVCDHPSNARPARDCGGFSVMTALYSRAH
jgi:hypothetical protein